MLDPEPNSPPPRGRDAAERASAETVAVYAPLGRDAELLCAALIHAGHTPVTCKDAREAVRLVQEGIGALLITNEALEQCDIGALGGAISKQPPWSDLPVVYLCGPGAPHGPEYVAAKLGNVVVIDRPTNAETIVAAIGSCLRARRRQYAFRDLLRELETQKAEIASLNERLVRSMRETHHRVKNNLQVVAALVDLRCMDGAEKLSLDEFRRIGSHVQTLAVVHDILTAQAKDDATVGRVSARTILEKLLPKLQLTAPHCDISFQVEDVDLTVRQATALALLTYELVANGIKHGKGNVNVELVSSAGSTTLVVTDDGPGFPPRFDPVKAANTGLDLVENISRRDLRGIPTYATTPSGGQVCVSFPENGDF